MTPLLFRFLDCSVINFEIFYVQTYAIQCYLCIQKLYYLKTRFKKLGFCVYLLVFWLIWGLSCGVVWQKSVFCFFSQLCRQFHFHFTGVSIISFNESYINIFYIAFVKNECSPCWRFCWFVACPVVGCGRNVILGVFSVVSSILFLFHKCFNTWF